MRDFFRNVYLDIFGSFSSPAPEFHLLNCHFSGKNLGENCFKEFFHFLYQHVEFVDYSYAVSSIVEGRKKCQRPSVALSFDDGFLDCYEHVFPILIEHKIQASFFINSSFIDAGRNGRELADQRIDRRNRKFMNWKMIEEMHDFGQIIGSHSLNHFRLSELDFKDFVCELMVNDDILSNKLGARIEHFAWPYGGLNDVSLDQLNFIKSIHPYIYSSTKLKSFYVHDFVLNRRHIEPFWPSNHIKYFLSHEKE